MERIFKEKAEEYKSEFGEKAYRVVELLIEEYNDDLESRKAYKRCGLLLGVLEYLK
tara:strand:+ start:175 stop:342 length:168 start_codon:yes stop_codon:yes gene_type:complete